MTSPKIIYTQTDEAPALATVALLPIIKYFSQAAGIEIETKNISLAGRIIANFSDFVTAEQQQSDALSELGELTQDPTANIIKLPNISASIPQLKAAIKELKDHGYGLPDYPENPQTDEEKTIKIQYSKVLGSAVNPILREGNSDRRVAAAVKQYAKDNPHRMGEWQADSKSHVASMTDHDFYANEQSVVMTQADNVVIQFTDQAGKSTVLKQSTPLLKGEVIDTTCMSHRALINFYQQSIDDAKKEDVLLSLHLKATMMKVSDPIMFGFAVKVYYKAVFDKYADLFNELGIDPNNGLGDIYNKIKSLDAAKQAEIIAEIEKVYQTQPALAMVDSDKGITNLHVPSNVIVDASMPAAIRSSGKMWDSNGQLKDMKAMIPDRCYAGIYQETIEFCKKHGAFDVSTMGSVANVGLMAKKAEEYGSHDKTFQAKADGKIEVINQAGDIVMSHRVEKGDIWRMCQTKDEAVVDWVKLAVNRATLTKTPAIFWLDPNRAHDRNIIDKVKTNLKYQAINGLDIQIMSPIEATAHSLQVVKDGKDIISVTGNVLRDYLTDLFPILELGTSAKMLSIVPLLAGGGLFETGAGGSAPKHVEQFLNENHLRWDSLGEYLALAVSLEDLAEKTKNHKIRVLADGLNQANSQYLKNNHSPSRKVGELDNRGSHFYIALYWSSALAEQQDDSDLNLYFTPIAKQLSEHKDQILAELMAVQGKGIDLGGYYQPDMDKITAAMRPSQTLNKIF